jgi:predicted transglutaminase-like cysteine proteinase
MLQKPHSRKPETDVPQSLKKSFFKRVNQKLKAYQLGDLLVASGVISSAQLAAALQEQSRTGGLLGTVLVRQQALTAVQLYRTLAEQWCLKATAAGITVLMQTMVPVPAQAGQSGSGTMAAEFTLASNTHDSARRNYPVLFGTHETRSNDITAFKKWTEAMHRFERDLRSSAGTPQVASWEKMISSLKGRSQRDQIEGVNAYLNQIPYIEDIDNYGKTDYWATPVEFLTRGGDCEDFAIAKYASFRALGFSADQLRVAIVQDKVKNIPHAVLIVYSDAGNFVLDNQNKSVQPITAVNRYQPIFSINSTSWWLHHA